MKNPFDNLDSNCMSGSDPLDDLMNNFHDILQQSDHHGDSLFSGDDTGHSDWNDSHSLLNDNLHDSGISDMNHSEWNDLHSGIHDNLHDSGMSDTSHSDWNDSNTGFNDNFHDSAPANTHHTDSFPDLTSSDHNQYNFHHDPNQMIHHSLDSVQAHSVHFRSSTESSHPYITMGDSGYVYLNGDKEVGHINGHTVYNKSDWNCGYWTTDGKVYDYHDNLVGWVHPDGHVYAKGKDGDLEVYETDKGVAGGAAYLLLVWCGGQTH